MMETSLNALVAGEHMADLRRAADMRRDVGGWPSRDRRADASIVVLRSARGEDAGAVHRLAELDEAPEPAGEVLLALIDGKVIAALSRDDGRVVADPFVATTEAVELLRVHARQLGGRRLRRRRWRMPLRPRFA